jgi:hypothetical protein
MTCEAGSQAIGKLCSLVRGEMVKPDSYSFVFSQHTGSCAGKSCSGAQLHQNFIQFFFSVLWSVQKVPIIMDLSIFTYHQKHKIRLAE